jgi:hypothetical protein
VLCTQKGQVKINAHFGLTEKTTLENYGKPLKYMGKWFWLKSDQPAKSLLFA